MKDLTLLLPILALACGNGGPAPPLLFPYDPPKNTAAHFEARDSAGVRIVENGIAGSWGDESLELTEIRRLGAEDADTTVELFRVSALAFDHEGALYVGSSGSATIQVYDASGRFLRRIGRKGKGPGEFGMIHRIWLDGDTCSLWTATCRARRHSRGTATISRRGTDTSIRMHGST